MRELSWYDFSFCLKRTPRRVLELLKARPGKVFVGGGFVRAVIAGEHVNDIDLFCGSKDEAIECARFLLNLKEGEETRKIHETDNAYTVLGLRLPVQIIHRWTYDNPEQLMQSFDFTIAMAGFWWEKTGEVDCIRFEQKMEVPMSVEPELVPVHYLEVQGKWHSICDDRFYEDLAAKRLRYTSPQRNEDAGGSLLRVLKFYQRGYRIPLDSLGATIARLFQAVDLHVVANMEGLDREKYTAKILTGLLREVDPNVDPEHIAHLPALEDEDEQNVEAEAGTGTA